MVQHWTKWLLGIALLVCASARAQVTVAGNLKDLGLGNVTSQNSYVQFTLSNFGANLPMVVSTGVFVSPTIQFLPNGSGVISGSIEPNDLISPANTYYHVCTYNQGQEFRCYNYTILSTGGTFNLNTATALSSIPQPALLPSQAVSTVLAGPSTGSAGIPSFRILGGAELSWPTCTGAFNSLSAGALNCSTGAGTGTVTSASSGNLSPLFNVSVATPTTTPAFSFAAISQSQNLFFASPSGSSGNPSFRAMVAADVPASANSCAAHQWTISLASGLNVTCSQPAAADLSNGVTGTGAVVLATNPTITGAFDGTWTVYCQTGTAGCTYTSTGILGATVLPLNHTLVRMTMSSPANPLTTCSPSPVVSFRDETGGTNLFNMTFSNSTSFIDSGALSAAMTGGHKFSFNVTSAGTGCTTSNLNVVWTAVYE